MGSTVSFSFREDEEDLEKWVEQQYKEGNFRSRTDVIITALSEMRDRQVEGENVSEWKS